MEEHQNLVFCNRCDECYHTNCLYPRLRNVPTGNWLCPGCSVPRAQNVAANPPQQRAFDIRTVVRLAVERNRRMFGGGPDSDRIPKKHQQTEISKRKKSTPISRPRPRFPNHQDKSFGLKKEPTSAFSLFGNHNALDEPM